MMCCLCRRQRECHNTMAGDQDDDCMACSERDLFNLLGYDLEDNVPCTYSLASAGAASAGAASVGAASAGAASAGEVSLRPRSLLNPPITDQGTSTDQNAMGGDDRMALGRGKDTPSGSLDIIVELVKERREGRISHREFQDAKRQVASSSFRIIPLSLPPCFILASLSLLLPVSSLGILPSRCRNKPWMSNCAAEARVDSGVDVVSASAACLGRC